MKRTSLYLLIILILSLLSGCAQTQQPAQIAATTLPVYEFTSRLCEGTGITVTRVISDSISCLHDYSLSVQQVRAVKAAELIVVNGAGLEDFMADTLSGKNVITTAEGIPLLECADIHERDEASHDDHHHEVDSHIWLSPENAMQMAQTICDGLIAQYPKHTDTFRRNLTGLIADLEVLEAYGEEQLRGLSCRELVTFHDGFSYLAQAFDLTILEAVEEESGAEASAAELKHLISLVRSHDLSAIFTETNGSNSAASVIARETGAQTFPLDMVISGDSYFEAMYQNINTLKEALE